MKERKDLHGFRYIKAPDEAGSFLGYAAVFDQVDSSGDIIRAGAFKKTLRTRTVFPLLWSHDVTAPIGIVTGSEDSRGLAVSGHLNLDVEKAREVRALMKQGAINGLALGFEAGRHSTDRDGRRILEEIKIWEISPCVFPAQSSATVQDVKSSGLTEEENMELLEALYRQSQMLNIILRAEKIRLELEEIKNLQEGDRT